MKKIIILNFLDSSVHVFNYDSSLYEDSTDFVNSNLAAQYSISESNSQWMVTDDLNIQQHFN